MEKTSLKRKQKTRPIPSQSISPTTHRNPLFCTVAPPSLSNLIVNRAELPPPFLVCSFDLFLFYTSSELLLSKDCYGLASSPPRLRSNLAWMESPSCALPDRPRRSLLRVKLSQPFVASYSSCSSPSQRATAVPPPSNSPQAPVPTDETRTYRTCPFILFPLCFSFLPYSTHARTHTYELPFPILMLVYDKAKQTLPHPERPPRLRASYVCRSLVLRQQQVHIRVVRVVGCFLYLDSRRPRKVSFSAQLSSQIRKGRVNHGSECRSPGGEEK